MHPDKVTATQKNETTTKFQIVNKIYEILYNEGARAIYDEHGTTDCTTGIIITDSQLESGILQYAGLFPQNKFTLAKIGLYFEI